MNNTLGRAGTLAHEARLGSTMGKSGNLSGRGGPTGGTGVNPAIEIERQKIRDLHLDIMKIKEIQEPYKAMFTNKKDLVPGLINEIKSSVLSMLHEQETINKNIKGYKPDFKVPVNDPTIEKTKEVDAQEASNNKKLEALNAEDQKKKDDASEARKKAKGSVKSGSLRDDQSQKTTSEVVKETEYISYRQELY